MNSINEKFHAANSAVDVALEVKRSAWRHGSQAELDAACAAHEAAVLDQKQAAKEWENEWHRTNRLACPSAYAPAGYVNL